MKPKKRFNKKYRGIGILLFVLIGLSIFIIFYFSQIVGEKEFEVDRLFLKIVLEEQGSTQSTINILNKGPNNLNFSIKVNEIEDLVSIKETEFLLGFEKEKEIELLINSFNDTEPGVYVGNIEINSGTIVKKIPLIIEVQTKNILFSSNINLIPSLTDLVPGQRLESEIKVFNLESLGRSNVKLIYFIKDFEGRTIVSESEDLIVEGSSLEINKILDLPVNLRLGDYVFIVLTEYENSVETSTKLFKIVKTSEPLTGNGLDSNLFIIIFTIFGFFFMVFLILLIYSIFYRDKLLIELQKQYKNELKRQNEFFAEKEKQAYSKLKTIFEKEEYKREAEEVKRQRLDLLEKQQKKRIDEFNKIKKTKNISKLKKQIELWKKQGYDTRILEQKFKLPSISSIRNKIKKWKKQGYDTSVLEKQIKNK